MRYAIMSALLFCNATFVCAAESKPDAVESGNVTTKPESVLIQAEQALQSALADLGEAVTFEYAEHSRSLTVKYLSRKFMVHGGSKTGAFSEELREPSDHGLAGADGPRAAVKPSALEIPLEDLGESHAASPYRVRLALVTLL